MSSREGTDERTEENVRRKKKHQYKGVCLGLVQTMNTEELCIVILTDNWYKPHLSSHFLVQLMRYSESFLMFSRSPLQQE